MSFKGRNEMTSRFGFQPFDKKLEEIETRIVQINQKIQEESEKLKEKLEISREAAEKRLRFSRNNWAQIHYPKFKRGEAKPKETQPFSLSVEFQCFTKKEPLQGKKHSKINLEQLKTLNGDSDGNDGRNSSQSIKEKMTSTNSKENMSQNNLNQPSINNFNEALWRVQPKNGMKRTEIASMLKKDEKEQLKLPLFSAKGNLVPKNGFYSSWTFSKSLEWNSGRMELEEGKKDTRDAEEPRRKDQGGKTRFKKDSSKPQSPSLELIAENSKMLPLPLGTGQWTQDSLDSTKSSEKGSCSQISQRKFIIHEKKKLKSPKTSFDQDPSRQKSKGSLRFESGSQSKEAKRQMLEIKPQKMTLSTFLKLILN